MGMKGHVLADRLKGQIPMAHGGLEGQQPSGAGSFLDGLVSAMTGPVISAMGPGFAPPTPKASSRFDMASLS